MTEVEPSNHVPTDRFNLAYIFLLIHGIGFLLPWNVFINAREYFIDYKLNTTTSYDADYRLNFMSYIGFAAQFPGLCFAAWNTFHQGRAKSSNSAFRFIVAMAVEILVLIFTIALTMVDTSQIPGTFFSLTIASVVLINCCVGIHQTLTFGMAAVLPMRYSNAVIIGSNACGTIISTVNIITKWIASVEGRTPRTIVAAAIAYFLSAFAIVIACVVTFFSLLRLPFVRYYVDLCQRPLEVLPPHASDTSPTSKLPVPDETHGSSCATSSRSSLRTRVIPSDSRASSGDLMETVSLLNVEEVDHVHRGRQKGTWCSCFCINKRNWQHYWSRYAHCLSECWPQCLNVWAVFFCSLSVFPAIQSMVKPIDPNYFIRPVWFVDVTCFLFFNLFAMFGCILCNWVQFPGPRHLWIPVWIRVAVFIPFFLFCNFNFAEPKLPVLIANDHIYVFGAIVFSFTNGYLSSLAVMYAPKSCPPERAELAGMLAAFFLMLGVCSGVYASRGFVSIVL